MKQVPLKQKPNKNVVVNGGFHVWQLATAFNFASSASGYTADQWNFYNGCAGAFTVSEDSDSPTVEESGTLSTDCILIDCTTADATVGANDRVILYQPIEGYNFAPLARKKNTISLWVKFTKVGFYGVWLVNAGGDRTEVQEFEVIQSDVWEKKILRFDESPSAGTWNYTNGVGIYLGITIMAGTDWQTTSGTWQTGDFHATSNQANGADDTANNFRITMVKFEEGTVATDFESEHYNDTLLKCERYLQRSGSLSAVPALSNFVVEMCVAAPNNKVSNGVLFKRMRTIPTVTLWGISNDIGQAFWIQHTVASTSLSSTALEISEMSFYVSSGATDSLAANHVIFKYLLDARL